jgi:hypothetical protein
MRHFQITYSCEQTDIVALQVRGHMLDRVHNTKSNAKDPTLHPAPQARRAVEDHACTCTPPNHARCYQPRSDGRASVVPGTVFNAVRNVFADTNAIAIAVAVANNVRGPVPYSSRSGFLVADACMVTLNACQPW